MPIRRVCPFALWFADSLGHAAIEIDQEPSRDKRSFDPDQLWVADITQVRTWSGWLYSAVVFDAWSQRIVGWAMAPRTPPELVGEALRMAITCRLPEGPVIHHSD